MTSNRKLKLIEDHIIGCAFSATRAEEPAQYIDVNRTAIIAGDFDLLSEF